MSTFHYFADLAIISTSLVATYVIIVGSKYLSNRLAGSSAASWDLLASREKNHASGTAAVRQQRPAESAPVASSVATSVHPSISIAADEMPTTVVFAEVVNSVAATDPY